MSTQLVRRRGRGKRSTKWKWKCAIRRERKFFLITTKKACFYLCPCSRWPPAATPAAPPPFCYILDLCNSTDSAGSPQVARSGRWIRDRPCGPLRPSTSLSHSLSLSLPLFTPLASALAKSKFRARARQNGKITHRVGGRGDRLQITQ